MPWREARRGWDFRSVDRGGVWFEEIIRALNMVGYDGPLSVEWEHIGVGREHGVRESCQSCRNVDFEPSSHRFDDAFSD